jgi:transcriptional regulator with XRE-family HTH domain
LKTLGNLLRELREQKKLLIREVAASLSLDQTLLSKIERDERKPTQEQLHAFCKLYKDEADEIETLWLSDKIMKELKDHKLADKALDMAKKQLSINTSTKKK